MFWKQKIQNLIFIDKKKLKSLLDPPKGEKGKIDY